jgi:hypothetical protein
MRKWRSGFDGIGSRRRAGWSHRDSVAADRSMALAKPSFGYHVDVHPEEILDRVRKPNECEQALASWHRDQ